MVKLAKKEICTCGGILAEPGASTLPFSRKMEIRHKLRDDVVVRPCSVIHEPLKALERELYATTAGIGL
jgi:hypothetical protein